MFKGVNPFIGARMVAKSLAGGQQAAMARRMTEDEARQVQLVRAIETEDRAAALLTGEDRLQADAQARTCDPAHFVANRAGFAFQRLATRHPGVVPLAEKTRWPGWVNWAIPLVALAVGFLANELGNAKRLELLAVPLLGTIAWNLFVYFWTLVDAVRGKHGGGLARAIMRLSTLGRSDFDASSPMGRAAQAFKRDWARLAAPLTEARSLRTMHLGAAMFALGIIGGIYLRALVIEYRAGWESTFLTPPAVRGLLASVLGPASAVTGIAIPPVNEIAAMRWTGPATGGVNAGPWLHLYTATLIGLIVLPRLLLAGWQGFKAARLARALPMPGREDFYIRRLERVASGRPGAIRVTPYAYRPDEATRRRLAAALAGALGDGAEVRFDEPVDYGGEDAWLAAQTLDPSDDYRLLLYTLSSTPEAENHGALARTLAERIAREHPGTVLTALVDEAPYRAHFAGQAGLDDRIAGRAATWRRILGEAGLSPLVLDLASSGDTALAQRLESGLVGTGDLSR